MKRVLSICFLSMLLLLAGFTAKAQVTTNCCFWLENMQPDTLQDISNLGIAPGAPALLPGHGNPLVLDNTLSRVDEVTFTPESYGTAHPIGTRTDWYRVRFTNNCNLPANTKVSLEWKLYNNGVLIPYANLSDYVDMFIYTSFDQLANTSNVNATCGHSGWLGGPVYAEGVCHEVGNNCVGGYPGSMVVDNNYTYAQYGFTAAGYVRLANAYNLDYFYINFFASSETRIALRWKRVGNYSLVVGLRERTDGTDYAIWNDPGQTGYIGGHQSCCGALLAQDSIHYLVETTSQKVICERDFYMYGRPLAMYTQTGMYNVLFGTYECGHWKVDSVDLLDFQTRPTPDIVGHDASSCKNEPITLNDILALAPPVNTDTMDYIYHEIYWKTGVNGTFSQTPIIPDNTYPHIDTFYVYQVNAYRIPNGDTLFCTGYTDSFLYEILEILPPVLDNTPNYFAFCNEDITPASEQIIKAKLNNIPENQCAVEIHWFLGTTATGTPMVTTASNTVNLSSIYTNNIHKIVKITAFSYAPSTGTYSPTGATVTFEFFATPEITMAADTQYVVCPHTPITLHNAAVVTNINAAGQTTGVNGVNWQYVWTKNGSTINANTPTLNINAPGCATTDVYTVTATATSIENGCDSARTRVFTVISNDTMPLTIRWRNNATAQVRISGCDTTTKAWSAPYTMANVSATGSSSIIQVTSDRCSNVQNIHYSVSINTTLAPCTTIVTRSYYVTDECNNQSNTISQVVTIVNDTFPTLAGNVDTVLPVRPLNNDCKDDMPARSVLLNSLHNNFQIHSACGADVDDDDIHFYVGNVEVAALDGHIGVRDTNIFANTNEVHVLVSLTDECGNTTPVNQRQHVITLFKPAQIDIAHGATLTPDYEVCNYDTVSVTFDTLMIYNGFSPYQYAWSQDPKPEECGIIYHADDPTVIDVYALVGGAYYTSSQFIMTITDKYGCVAADTSNAIHFFPVPTVNIVEDPRNDDYAHAEPVVVCPTFGHFLIEAQATDNLPLSYDHTLTYVWSGEAIDYTSTDEHSFIAVNENICHRIYTAYATVTNTMGCITVANYSIEAVDTEAPVLSVDLTTDTIPVNAPNCKIIVPDYTHLFNVNTVSDNCWNMDSTVVTQVPAAGTLIGVNTDVVVTVAPKCGPAATHTIRVCFPEPFISTTISATVDSACYPYTTTLTTTTLNGTPTYTVVWNGSDAVDALVVSPTETSRTHNVVVVTDAHGCQATDTIDLVVYHKPVAGDVNITSTPNNYCDDLHANGSMTVTAVHPDIDSVRLAGTTEWHALPYTTDANLPHGTYAFDLHTIHDCYTAGIAVGTIAHDTTIDNLAQVLTLSIYTNNDYCTAPWHGTIDVVYPVSGYTYHIGEYVHVLDNGELDTCGNETHLYNPDLESDLWFNYLYQGVYAIEITTNFNCHYVTDSIEVLDARITPPVPQMVIVPNTSCAASNGSVRLVNTDPKYYYTLNGITWRGNLGARTFGLLPAGSYNLNIYNDITRCSNDTTIVVPDGTVIPTFSANEVNVQPRTNCTVPNGEIHINAQGGYLYFVMNTAGDTISAMNYNAMESGDFTVRKYNFSTGCYKDTIVNIPFNRPVFEYTLSHVNDMDCSNEIGTGSISVVPALAADYHIYNSLHEEITFTGLNPGVYTVEAYVAATQCTYSKTETVGTDYTYPELVFTSTPNYNCYPTKNGTITAVDNQAHPNYTSLNYYLDGVAVNYPITGLNSGTYNVYAITNLHCSSNAENVVVVDSAFFARQYDIVPNSTCDITLSRPGNGQIHVLTPQGTHYLYVFTYIDTILYNYDVDHFEPIDYTKFTLADGHYSVHITDTVTGCEYTDTVFVPFIATPLTIDSIASTPDYSCRADLALGTITVTAHSSSVSAVLTYSIDGGVTYQMSNVFTGLVPGTYNIVIRDTANNCVYANLPKSVIDVADEMYVLTFDADTTPNQYCDPTRFNGSITVNNIVNANPYPTSYLFKINGGEYQTSNVFTELEAGTYVVTVKDVYTGCEYTATAIIRLDNNYAPIVGITSTGHNDGGEFHFCKNSDGMLFANVTPLLPGDTLFTYAWYNDCPAGILMSDSSSVNVLTEIVHCCTYTVEVTSVLTGCKTIETRYVCVDSLPLVHFYIDHAAWTTRDPNNFFNCENHPLTIGIDPTGLVSHVWTNGIVTDAYEFTVPAFAIPAGETKSYCVTIVDNNGCSSTEALNVISKPIFRTSETINACNTYSFHGNKIADCVFTFNPAVGATNTHVVVDTLAALNGCDSIVTYTIIISALPVLDVTATNLEDVFCAGDVIVPTGLGFNHDYAVQYGWRIIPATATPNVATFNTAGQEFNINSPVSYGMTGSKIYAYSANDCDTLVSGAYMLTIHDVPTLRPNAPAMGLDTICAGNVPTVPALSAANIDWHGTTTGNECKIEYRDITSTAWNTWVPGTTLNNEGVYAFRFVAKNHCSGEFVTLDTMGVIVNGTVGVSIDNPYQRLCLGNAITPIVITTTNAMALTNDDVVITPNAGLTFDAATMTISGTPTIATTYSIAITATNEFVGSPCPTFTLLDSIVVNPLVTIDATNANQTICLGNPIDNVVISNANSTISHSILPVGLIFTGNVLSGAPVAVGTYTITFTATSNMVPQCESRTVAVNITVNDTVTLAVSSANADQTICLGETVADIVIANTNSTVAVTGLPAGMTYQAATNSIVGAPTAAGVYNYIITATSDKVPACNVKTIQGTITVNDTVVLTVSNNSQRLCLGNAIDPMTITNTNSTITVTGLPTGVTYTDATHVISGTPVNFGTFQYTVLATSDNGCTNKTFVGTIVVNDTVTLSATNLSHAICLGNPINDIVITNTNSTITVTGLPATLTYDDATHTISGTPTAFGPINYTIIATSNQNPACNAKTIVDVITVNDTVKLTADPAKLSQIVCREKDTIQNIVFNVENATLSIVGTLPAGITLNNNVISGTPTVMNTAGYTFTVLATSTADPACDAKTLDVTIVVNDKPSITAPISGGDLSVCDGQVFTMPTSPTAADVVDNGYPATSAWVYDGAEFDWTTPANLSMHQQYMYFAATNTCGTTRDSAQLTVYKLPVPEVVSDTMICLDGTAHLEATPGYVSYQWFMDGTAIAGATTNTYDYTADGTAGTHTFNVEVVDINGCTSVTNSNATIDTRHFSVGNAITVGITENPGFIFTHNGVVTHNFTANTNDPQTNYTWMINNPCEYNVDTLVFVTFDIYHNGQPIPNDSIDLYIQTKSIYSNTYVTYDSINWQSANHVDMHANCYYNYAASNNHDAYYPGNHYPSGTMGFPGNQKYDDAYLHFLDSVTVYKTINKFRRSGEYTIHYRLYSTSMTNHYQGLYYNEDQDAILTIGGSNSTITSAVLTELAYDVLTIVVEGPDNAYNPDETITGIVEHVTESAASMEVYPNPATTTVNARIKGVSGETSVRIVNIAGQVVAQDNVVLDASEFVYTTQIRNLTPGVYFMYVEGENATLSRKLVVTR